MEQSLIQLAQKKGSHYALQATVYIEVLMLVLLSLIVLAASGSFQMLADVFSYLEIRVTASFILSSFIFADLFGKVAIRKLLHDKQNEVWIGMGTALVIIICSTMLASLVAFSIQLMDIGFSEKWLLIYFVRPLLWIVGSSIIPVLIAGAWFAYKLKKTKKLFYSGSPTDQAG